MERETLSTWIDAGSRLTGLSIEPAWREGVVLNLERLAAMAACVNGFELSETVEPAPRFDAQAPE